MQSIGAKSSRQTRPGVDDHVVYAGVARVLGIVRNGLGELAGNVLYECSTEGDVHDLDTATNGQRGQAAPSGFENERYLAFVALVMSFDRGMGLLAITSRRHILATGDNETRDAVENGSSGRRWQRWDNEWHETGIGECRGVRQVDAYPRRATNDLGCGCDGDQGGIGAN